MLGDHKGKGLNISGEVWAVSDETLKAMDDYEGLRKGYYSREKIPVTCSGVISPIGADNFPESFARDTKSSHSVAKTDEISVYIYFKTKSDPSLLEQEFLPAYTYELHKQVYKPIRHIQVKQRAYLGIDYELGH